MNKHERSLLLAVLVTALTGFGCAAPYQKSGLSGGFAEKQLEPGVFTVVFRGNEFTSTETVRKYILYRAAEIAIANRCEYLAFVKDSRRENMGDVDWVALASGTSTRVSNLVGGRGYSGKSAAIYAGYGVPIFRVFNADKLAKYSDAIAARKIIARFGPEILQSDRARSAPPNQR